MWTITSSSKFIFYETERVTSDFRFFFFGTEGVHRFKVVGVSTVDVQVKAYANAAWPAAAGIPVDLLVSSPYSAHISLLVLVMAISNNVTF